MYGKLLGKAENPTWPFQASSVVSFIGLKQNNSFSACRRLDHNNVLCVTVQASSKIGSLVMKLNGNSLVWRILPGLNSLKMLFTSMAREPFLHSLTEKQQKQLLKQTVHVFNLFIVCNGGRQSQSHLSSTVGLVTSNAQVRCKQNQSISICENW